MHTFLIDGRCIGADNPPYLIAEIGLNHGGSMAEAKKLIRAAADAGAHAVKLQVFRSEELVAPTSQFYNVLSSLALDESDVRELVYFAAKENISLFASVFDEPSLQLMVELDTPAIKVASGDITHLPLLRAIGRAGRPVILSTGGASMCDIQAAMAAIKDGGYDTPIALLHCVSNYPTAPEHVNLACLETMKQQFGVPIGFSDHTIGPQVSIAAVALGAKLIEKHFTLDRNADGPDHILSEDPHGLRMLAEGIECAWKCIGSAAKVPVEDGNFVKQIRRSVHARSDIPAGSTLTAEMLSVRRPGIGIAPGDLDRVLGRTVIGAITSGQPITWGDLR